MGEGGVCSDDLFYITGNLPWLDGVIAFFMGSNPSYTYLEGAVMEIVKLRKVEKQGKVSKEQSAE